MHNSEIKYIASRSIKSDSAWLLQHRYNVTSQTGDDGIIAKIFEVMTTRRAGGLRKAPKRG